MKLERQPDFSNILKVLKCQKPERPTLFEFFMNDEVYERLTGDYSKSIPEDDKLRKEKILIEAFKNAGYDYVTLWATGYYFKYNEVHSKKSRSLNEGMTITDRKSFHEYKWPEPDDYDYSKMDILKNSLPDGMKIIVANSESVYGGTVRLVGYDNMCYMLYEDEELLKEIIDAIGTRILRYNEIASGFDTVGAIILNDDWGHRTQTQISPGHLRKFIFPWIKKITEVIHKAGKPVILHSCGNLKEVYEDIIDELHFDGKHSFEDVICPVEDMYDKYAGRIAIMGGIDVDFLVRSAPEIIEKRAVDLILRAQDKGGYALGSGNSIPKYVPYENYLAMIRAINFV